MRTKDAVLFQSCWYLGFITDTDILNIVEKQLAPAVIKRFAATSSARAYEFIALTAAIEVKVPKSRSKTLAGPGSAD